MAVLGSCLLLLRRASSSYLVPLATRSVRSSSILRHHNGLLASRFLPMSTSSGNTPLETSDGSPPVAEIRSLKQTALGTSKNSYLHSQLQLHGLPFDSIEEDEDETITLARKLEDEIIEIKVIANMDDDDGDGDGDGDGIIQMRGKVEGEKSNEVEVTDVPFLAMLVRVLYGNNFNKCLEIFCRVFPDNHDRIDIDLITFRTAERSDDDVGQKHLDEFEDFFKKRGIEPCNLNFLFSYIEKRIQMDKDGDSTGKKVRKYVHNSLDD